MNKARHLWFSCFTIALLLVSSILAGTTTNAAPTEAPWSPAVRIEGGSLPTLFPEIVADNQGALHAVFEEASDDLLTRRIMYTNNIGGSFKTPVHISTVSGSTVSGNPKLAFRGNRIDVIFHSRSGGLLNGRLYYTTSSDRGTSWSTPNNLSGSIPAFDAAITIDALNGSHVVYGGYTGGETYAVFYTTKPNGGTWSNPVVIAERIPGNSYNNYPDIISTFANSTVSLHVFFMGNTIPGQELNKSVYSLRKVGGAPWTTPVLRGGSGANYPKLATDGDSTLWATWQAALNTNFETFQSKSTDNGATWSTPTNRSNNSGLSARPDVARAGNGSVMLVWDDSQGDSDAKQDIWSGFSPDGTNWQSPVRIFSAPGFSKEVEVAGSCDTFHSVWHDAGTGDNKLHVMFSQTGTPKPCGVVAPDFTPTRTSSSPTSNPTIQVSLNDLSGSPDQMRYSLTPFAAGDAAPAWTALTGTISVNASSITNCSATVYIQVKNNTTGQVSTVKTVTAVIDTEVQASVTIQTMEDAANRLQAPTVEQPNAPAAGHPEFTRKSIYSYTVGQEPGSCAGVDKHDANGTAVDPSAYPYTAIGMFAPFDETADSNGVGYNEQTIQATLRVTDTLGHNKTFTRQFRYDDDPPVLEDGATAAMVGTNPTNQALVTVAFTATVTDDSYGAFINQPNAAFWGAWVLATNTSTAPTPAQFEQYGSSYTLMPGSTQIENVLLINGLVNGAGPRYVHIRFLDGAGNYTETVLTSAEITLQDPIQKPRVLLPFITK